MVFFYHYGALNPGIRMDLSVPVIGAVLQFPLGLGFAGVDLFFVLSGFLLSLPFAQAALTNTPKTALKTYYKRRLLRVFPAYYAQLGIILLLGAWFVSYKPVNGVSLLAHLGMFFNIGWHPVRPMVGIWWTLPVELAFYLLLPIIAVFLRPARWLLFLVTSIALSVLYRYWCVEHFATAGRCGWSLSGGFTATGLLAGISSWCLRLYLWHFVVMQQATVIFGDDWANLSQLTRFLASTGLVIMVSSLSYYLIERPFFRLAHKRRPAAKNQTLRKHIS